jgi:hypothetical protein
MAHAWLFPDNMSSRRESCISICFASRVRLPPSQLKGNKLSKVTEQLHPEGKSAKFIRVHGFLWNRLEIQWGDVKSSWGRKQGRQSSAPKIDCCCQGWSVARGEIDWKSFLESHKLTLPSWLRVYRLTVTNCRGLPGLPKEAIPHSVAE